MKYYLKYNGTGETKYITAETTFISVGETFERTTDECKVGYTYYLTEFELRRNDLPDYNGQKVDVDMWNGT